MAWWLRTWLLWVLATAGGWALGVAFPALLSAAERGAGDVDIFAQLFMVIAVGLGLGVGQGLVLERYWRGVGLWALSTTVALPLGAVGGMALIGVLYLRVPAVMRAGLLGVGFGGAVGLAAGLLQAAWLVNRGVLGRLAALWVGANVAGWTAAALSWPALGALGIAPWLGVPADSVGERPAVPLPLFLAAWLLAGGALGAVLGAVTGVALVAVLRGSGRREREGSGGAAKPGSLWHALRDG